MPIIGLGEDQILCHGYYVTGLTMACQSKCIGVVTRCAEVVDVVMYGGHSHHMLLSAKLC